jgi:hypothetical protein
LNENYPDEYIRVLLLNNQISVHSFKVKIMHHSHFRALETREYSIPWVSESSSSAVTGHDPLVDRNWSHFVDEVDCPPRIDFLLAVHEARIAHVLFVPGLSSVNGGVGGGSLGKVRVRGRFRRRR